MRAARIALAGSLIAMVTLLASCSSPGIGVADSRESGVPDGVELEKFSTDPSVFEFADGSVKVVTYGSSSCPATATSFENDGSTLAIGFELDSSGPCTDDMAPTTHTFSAEKVGDTVPGQATVYFPEFDEEHVVDVVQE